MITTVVLNFLCDKTFLNRSVANPNFYKKGLQVKYSLTTGVKKQQKTNKITKRLDTSSDQTIILLKKKKKKKKKRTYNSCFYGYFSDFEMFSLDYFSPPWVRQELAVLTLINALPQIFGGLDTEDFEAPRPP